MGIELRSKPERAIDRGRREARRERAAAPAMWWGVFGRLVLPLGLFTGWGLARTLEGKAYGPEILLVGAISLTLLARIAVRDWKTGRGAAQRRTEMRARRRERRKRRS